MRNAPLFQLVLGEKRTRQVSSPSQGPQIFQLDCPCLAHIRHKKKTLRVKHARMTSSGN